MKRDRRTQAQYSLIEKAYYKHASGTGRGISVLDIPKLFDECRAALDKGEDLDKAVEAAIEKFKVPV